MRIIRPLARAIVRTAATVAALPPRLDQLGERLAGIEATLAAHLTHKRKHPTRSVRDLHVAAIREMGGRCPFCDVSIFDDAGTFVGVVHHHEKASDAGVAATMPACAACNLAFNTRPAPRSAVDEYHRRRVKLPGLLFQRRGRAA
jgi:hypothetical protein